jgi:hypothetical protein
MSKKRRQNEEQTWVEVVASGDDKVHRIFLCDEAHARSHIALNLLIIGVLRNRQSFQILDAKISNDEKSCAQS